MTAPGKFYGVGVGPGDPELLTLKAARILGEVDWIYHPAGPSGSFAARVLEPLRLPATKFCAVSLCMARDREPDQRTFRRTATAMGEELRQGKSVAWITAGDPLFYSTFVPLSQELLEQCPGALVEIIPGVSSIHAATALVGVPGACLDERVAVVPAAYGVQDLPNLLDSFATVFLLKVNSVMDVLLTQLAAIPFQVQAWYLERVGTPAARVVSDLATLRGQELPYFSLVLLRRVRPDREGKS
jgi:precorrin-2/cobalt-factor-2 C20-methyltransferase